LVNLGHQLSSLLAGGEKWEIEKALRLWKHCSETAKTLICYQHCFNHKTKIQHLSGCYEEN